MSMEREGGTSARADQSMYGAAALEYERGSMGLHRGQLVSIAGEPGLHAYRVIAIDPMPGAFDARVVVHPSGGVRAFVIGGAGKH